MNRISIFVILVLAAIAAVIAAVSCSRENDSGKVESITIGTLPYEASALIYIADAQKLFKANSLDVTIKNYETGLAATMP